MSETGQRAPRQERSVAGFEKRRAREEAASEEILPQAVEFLLSLQRTAGNAAVNQLLRPYAVQRQRTGGPRPPGPARAGRPAQPRPDLIFIMGQDRRDRRGRLGRNRFYTYAVRYFAQQAPAARIVDEPYVRTLTGVIDYLRTLPPATRVGNLTLVTHAVVEGLASQMSPDDPTAGTSFGELQAALSDPAQRQRFALPAGQVDGQTHIHIRGCNIGRNRQMLELLRQSFGGPGHGAGTIDAPTHRQRYAETRPGHVSEFYVDYTVEVAPGERPNRAQLRARFLAKYPQLAPQWAHVGRRVRPHPIELRFPRARLEGRVSNEEIINAARPQIANPERYQWTVRRVRGAAVVVIRRMEYCIQGQIRDAEGNLLQAPPGEPTYLPQLQAPAVPRRP